MELQKQHADLEAKLLEKVNALEERDGLAKEAQKKQDQVNAQLMELQKQHADLQAKLQKAEDECNCTIM